MWQCNVVGAVNGDFRGMGWASTPFVEEIRASLLNLFDEDVCFFDGQDGPISFSINAYGVVD